MKLSIITVNLNDEQGLEKTLSSIISQSFTNYEIIVIDGASKDNSVNVIKKYEHKISYWVSEKDSGVYNAMNKGIVKAQGEYCYFLNSGDILASKDVLSKVFETNPSVSFICTNYTTESKGILNLEKPYRNKDWTFSLYDIYRGDLCHQAFFIRRDNFSKYGLYVQNIRITADWRLFFTAIGIHGEGVEYKDIDLVIYNLEGLSAQVGGEAIYKERQQSASELVSPQLATKLDRLYYLEQNGYIVDIIRSHKWTFNLFRAYCRLGRAIGFIKS